VGGIEWEEEVEKNKKEESANALFIDAVHLSVRTVRCAPSRFIFRRTRQKKSFDGSVTGFFLVL
jgi:hypothetical protein